MDVVEDDDVNEKPAKGTRSLANNYNTCCWNKTNIFWRNNQFTSLESSNEGGAHYDRKEWNLDIGRQTNSQEGNRCEVDF